MALQGKRRPSDPSTTVHRVTSAQESLSEEQSRRARRYLISMSIRTVCFIAVVFTHGWLQWAFVAGAVFLPYLAVIAANAGRENDEFVTDAVAPASSTELPAYSTRIISADDEAQDRPGEPGPAG
jgi:hypothetical protein